MPKKKSSDEEYQPGAISQESVESEDDDFKPRRPIKSKRISSTTSSKEKSNKRGKSGYEKKDDKVPCKTMKFCPLCQVPLSVLKISPQMHTASCCVSADKACPEGVACLNPNYFHYRDYSHHELAAFRDSEDYIAPDVVFTPQKSKLKVTPVKSSDSKKRPSKSPAGSVTSKISKREDACHSRDPPPTSSSADSSDETIYERKKKRLTFTDDPDDPPEMERNPSEITSALDTVEEPFSEPVDVLQSSLWCSDLVLSGDPRDGESSEPDNPSLTDANEATLCPVKEEPESQNDSEVVEPAATVPQTCNAEVIVQYSNTTEEDNVKGNKVKCTEKCLAAPSDSDTLRANCSVVFKAKGVDRAEAMARSPMSVSLSMNSFGWQAVEIRGTKNSSAQKIQISLCECGHAVGVECCMHNRDIHSDVKFNPKDIEQEEIFFATMADLGLRNEPLYSDFCNRKKYVENTCNQITVSSCSQSEHPAHPEANSTAQAKDIDNTVKERNLSDHPPKTVNAFSLLQGNSKNDKKRPSSVSSGSNSRPSTPTSAAMVVSHSTGSSWTLVPNKGQHGSSSNTFGRSKASVGNRKVPAYKRIPDTQFVVDAFNFGVIPGVKIYFLSHFHSDHYMGLNKSFDMPIYCSQVTANLVHLKLRVAKQHLHVLKVGAPRMVSGVEVEVFDAFHCPGAIMFLFRLADGRVFLHVGDFRAHPSMEDYPQLRCVDKLYLDTTYCDPAYDFPSQEDVVCKVVQTVREHLEKNKSTLIVSGTYTIGKEKVFMGIAEEFDFKIWTTADKRKIYECLEDKKLLNRLTANPSEAQIHVLAMKDIALENLLQHLQKHGSKYSHVVGFKPTGWQTSTSLKGKPSDFQKSTRGKATIYGVPYSEHSSYSELQRFVRFVKPHDIQVTVNVGKSAHYRKLFQKWLSNTVDSQPKMMQYLRKDLFN